MTDRDTLLEQIADDVKALTEPRRHVEPYRYEIPGTRKIKWYGHHVHLPSLLDQLRAGGVSAEGGTRGYESKPPFALDCLDRLLAIETGSAWWATAVLIRPKRDSCEGNLRSIVGHARDLYLDADLADLAHDVRRWHGWASVLTGWSTPPYRPHASCPHCAHRGDLRIRLDDQTATCMRCGSTWDRTTIGILAEHIKVEVDTPNDAEVG